MGLAKSDLLYTEQTLTFLQKGTGRAEEELGHPYGSLTLENVPFRKLRRGAINTALQVGVSPRILCGEMDCVKREN